MEILQLFFAGIFLIALLRVGFVPSKKSRECDKALWKLAADFDAKEKQKSTPPKAS